MKKQNRELLVFIGIGLLLIISVTMTDNVLRRVYPDVLADEGSIHTIGQLPVGSLSTPLPALNQQNANQPIIPHTTEVVTLTDPTPLSGEIIAVAADEIAEVRSAPLVPSYEQSEWSPPSLNYPTALHPYDHYWFIRPVSSVNVNYSLPYYHFGTNGPTNDYRLHHGVDLANPVGVEVRAAASGTILWADKGHFNEYEAITSYGNVIVIQHDFGYRGKTLYTLYAHLNEFSVQEGDHVEAGDVIGFIGQTGNVTGPHVHFEVRVERDFYYDVRNPDLWMAPYINTGTALGRLETSLGEIIYDADLEIIDPLKGYSIAETTSYSGNGVQSDDLWNENFVFANIPEGYYLVHAFYQDEYWTGEVHVIAGMSNWVDLAPALPPDPAEPGP